MAEQELSKERLAELKDELSKLLAMDRYTVVSRYPFIGGILMHLDLIPVRDTGCPTACTDGKRVYFDIAFYSGLSEAERVFVLAHETWHCVMLHIFRRQGRDPELWNIAIDMETNNIINKSCNDYIFHPPQGCLLPPQHLVDHSAEEIYEYLMQQIQQQKQSGGSGKDSANQKGRNGESNNISNQNKNRKGSSSSKLKDQFDGHKCQDDQQNGSQHMNGDGEVVDKYGKVGQDPDFRPSPQTKFADDMRDAVIAEAQKCERQQGDLPSAIKSLIEKYRKPEIRWQDELAKFVTPMFGGKRQWLPPQRRHIYNEMYFQSRRSESIDVVVVIDTSGSCLGDLPKFFTELCGLIGSFGHYKMMVIQCDCEVSDVKEYDSEGEIFDPDTKFEASGGGGTSFCPPFEYLKERGISPECLVYFTDGYGDAPDKNPGFPVLWILTSDGSEDFCSWGKKIRFKESNPEKSRW